MISEKQTRHGLKTPEFYEIYLTKTSIPSAFVGNGDNFTHSIRCHEDYYEVW